MPPHAPTQLRLARSHARHEYETKPKPISRLGSAKASFPPTSDVFDIFGSFVARAEVDDGVGGSDGDDDDDDDVDDDKGFRLSRPRSHRAQG